MPVYPFKCSDCGVGAEITCSVSQYDDLGPMKCPECKSEMRRVYSAPNIIFKGHFPGKEIKWAKEDKRIQDAKAKVKRARENESIPASEKFSMEQAEKL